MEFKKFSTTAGSFNVPDKSEFAALENKVPVTGMNLEPIVPEDQVFKPASNANRDLIQSVTDQRNSVDRLKIDF